MREGAGSSSPLSYGATIKVPEPPFWPPGGRGAAAVLPACVERTVASWFGAVLRASVPPPPGDKFQQSPALTLASPAWKGAAKHRGGFPRPPCLHYAVKIAVVQHWGDPGSQQTLLGLGSGSPVRAPAPRPRCASAGLASLGGFWVDSLPTPFPLQVSPAFAFLLPLISQLYNLSDWLSAHGPLGFSTSSFTFLETVRTSDT